MSRLWRNGLSLTILAALVAGITDAVTVSHHVEPSASARSAADTQLHRGFVRTEGVHVISQASHNRHTGHPRKQNIHMSAEVLSTGVKYIAPLEDDADERDVLLAHDAPVRPVSDGNHSGTRVASGHANSSSSIVTDNSIVADREPSKAYFAIGIATFLAALAAMVLTLQKIDFTDEGGLLTVGNSETEDYSTPQSRDVTHPGDQVQHRMQWVLISWLFIFASTIYFMDFLALQAGFDSTQHWFGVICEMLWLLGFVLQFHWEFNVQSSKLMLVAIGLKVIASVLGHIHPYAMILGYKESDAAVWWPNLTALVLWQCGNWIAWANHVTNPPASSGRPGGLFAYSNLLITENWIDQLAIAMLIIASVSTTQWMGQPAKQLVVTKSLAVTCCQFSGAGLLLVGSCLRCEWCNGFRKWSHRPA